MFGDTNFGYFCANQNVVIEATQAFEFSARGKCPLAVACKHPWVRLRLRYNKIEDKLFL